MPSKETPKHTGYKGVYTLGERFLIKYQARCPRTGRLLYRKQILSPDATLGQAIDTLKARQDELRAQGASPDEPGTRSTHPSQTLRSYCVAWLARRSHRLRPNIQRLYALALAWHVLPVLGDVTLDALTRQHIEEWTRYASLKVTPAGRPYARESRRQWWRVLSSLLKDAHADGLLRADLTLRVEPPRGPKLDPVRETRTLSQGELARLLAAVEALHPERALEVLFLAATGVRSGELWALRWGDLDLGAQQATIRHSVQDQDSLVPTKTESPRVVPLPAGLVERLQAQRGARGEGAEIVFPSESGRYRTRGSLRKALTSASREAALSLVVTPQVLRRTFNTLLLSAGVDRAVLRAIMGHCSEEMTQRYAGVRMEAKQEAQAALVAALFAQEE
jgi:integrase